MLQGEHTPRHQLFLLAECELEGLGTAMLPKGCSPELQLHKMLTPTLLSPPPDRASPVPTSPNTPLQTPAWFLSPAMQFIAPLLLQGFAHLCVFLTSKMLWSGMACPTDVCAWAAACLWGELWTHGCPKHM